MKKIAIVWAVYVSVAVVLLPTWITWCMGGFSEKEVVYNEEVIETLQYIE